jgi:hypothetical protein
MRNIILVVRNSKPAVVARGLLTEAAYDELFATIYKDLTRESLGQLAGVDTLARKPLF